MSENHSRGLITHIQRFSIHDGPGIRTTVFFKGCPLRCFWCHNPETWRMQPEIQVFPDRCIGCGACLERCEQGVHQLEHGAHRFRRELCLACGRCAETCYAQALVLTGKWWTAEQLTQELLRDRPFYEQSDGGITLSGGEPLLQADFSLRLLQQCHQAGLHTAIETAALCPWPDLQSLLPWLDLVMMDIKLVDEAGHRAAAGAPNRLILDNARRLAQTAIPLIVRTPIIPTVNDTLEAVGEIASLIRDFPNLLYFELMPFHRLAQGKYHSLGLEYRAANLNPLSPDEMQTLARHAHNLGVPHVRVA